MKWIKAARGIRYREHPTRKNGLKPDRYYSIFFKVDILVKCRISDSFVKSSQARRATTKDAAQRSIRTFYEVVKVDGKQLGQGIGWGTEGVTIERAETLLYEFKANCKNGAGAKTLKEKRQIHDAQEAEEKRRQELMAIENISFKTFFETKYLPVQKLHKDRSTWNHARREGILNADSPTRNVKIPKLDCYYKMVYP